MRFDRLFRAKILSVWALVTALAGCATQPSIIPPPLDLPPRVAEQSALAPEAAAAARADERFATTPRPPAGPSASAPLEELAPPATETGKADRWVNFENLPLPSFIDVVYATSLKRNISIDPAVMERKDLVTLRNAKPLTAAQLEDMARKVLKTYGVAVIDVGGLVRFVPDTDLSGYNPEIRRGRALPETPMPIRPIFQLVELTSVRNTDVALWINTMFGSKVKLQEDGSRNAVMLSGTTDDVRSAIEAIKVLDQPSMRGRNSLRISPQFLSTDELARRLVEVLAGEGYSAAIGAAATGGAPILIVPISTINSLIVFTADQAILDHVVEWARTLDQPNERNAGRTLFSYPVKFTDAEALAGTLQQLLSGGALSTQAPTAGATAAPAASAANVGVVVDKGTNTIIFQSSGEDYSQILALLQRLDKPTREALIEVTVAEVRITDGKELGVGWLVKESGANGRDNIEYGTLPGDVIDGGLSTLGSAGFNFVLFNDASDRRVVLNALASSNRATVLSSPRVIAKNGETATIQVGAEVPVITSQQTNAATDGGVLNSVQYRPTGVILRVKPVIHSGDQVDIEISQEVSSAAATETGVSDSPTFSTRRLETKLSMSNGSTVLLGGLVSSNTTDGSAGVPLLKDIPLIGQAFRTNSKMKDKTELIIMITPYVINDDHDARAITEAFRAQLGDWAGKPAQANGDSAPADSSR